MNDIRLHNLATALPERFTRLADLRLTSPESTLRDFGFEGAWIADDIYPLALRAAQQALHEIAPAEIDHLLWASALPGGHQQSSQAGSKAALAPFCYSASRLQDDLGLTRAIVSGVAQQGCAGLFSALHSAQAHLVADPDLQHILCVGADALPSGMPREIMYNVISDAACAVVLSRGSGRYRWLQYHQVSNGYYWDVPARESEIIASYFPGGRSTIQGVLRKANLVPEDIDLVLPTGINTTSWPILLRLCGIPEDRLYQPQQRFGHTVAADSILMLEEAAPALQHGMRVLLFTFGFGSSWCALLLEVMS